MKIILFKKENNFKKKNFGFNTNFYWYTILIGAFALILLSSFFGYYLFMQISKESIVPITNDGEQVPTVSKVRLEKVLNYFSDREQKSSQISNSPAPVVDPSL